MATGIGPPLKNSRILVKQDRWPAFGHRVKARSSSRGAASRHNLVVAFGTLPLATMAGQEDTKEKKKLRLLEAALIDRARLSAPLDAHHGRER
jgi:hypothetical protein